MFFRVPFFLILFTGGLCLTEGDAWPQSSSVKTTVPAVAPTTAPAPAMAPAKAIGSGATVNTGPRWSELTPNQRQILHPLAKAWDGLREVQKSKWIALTQSFNQRSPAEQQTMQSRMVEWAALSPVQREQARLNFAESKKLAPADLAAEWAAYQKLSPEEKRALAAKGSGKPGGAAVATVPTPTSKLTPVPITRRTPATEAPNNPFRPRLDPKTLLPTPITTLAPVTPVSAPTVSLPPSVDSGVAPAPTASDAVASPAPSPAPTASSGS